MPAVPRLALGTVDEVTDPWPLLRVMLRGFANQKIHVQTFLARAAFGGFQELRAWSGATPRHLDSWLMSPGQCRSLFLEGVERADLALVLGRYLIPRSLPVASASGEIAALQNCPWGAGASNGRHSAGNGKRNQSCCLNAEQLCRLGVGGDLNKLCDWLGLTRLMVISARTLTAGSTGRVLGLSKCDGLFITDADPRVPPSRYAIDVAILFGVPLIGVVYRGRLSGAQDGENHGQWWTEGGLSLWWHFAEFERILARSATQPLPESATVIWDFHGHVQIAIARDAVFGCYFPEVLEILERSGARIVEFSPLRDERLPAETDVVYLGCGEPFPYAGQLADNHCLKAALRDFVRRGGRVYAEGAGAAYLCEWMEVATGSFIPGAGILPAAGRRLPRFGEPLPVTVTLRLPTWLADAGQAIRGYRNSQWWFEPESLSTGLVREPGLEYDMIGNAQVVASIIHVDFAAQPELLGRFFQTRSATGSPSAGSSFLKS